MLRAVFVRTLKPGVTYEQFKDAWWPEGNDKYPVPVNIARNTADDRQVVTILHLDMSLAEFEERRASLTRPDALERLAELVESTDLVGVFEDVCEEAAA
ncbi:hypothetical protein [Streptomyces chattanoogensis]|uniref:Uncharacterized protein n=1 Tax=Streptomyces chattanoogensis TaxID=66876 RepID=A0A0N0XTS6_9ACTN|nr:hypothetical protein [Streptomyces chattanoogensis]KPC61828.1 hypothetical protein ADL29_22375 [Streptomyces chattanoogensis]